MSSIDLLSKCDAQAPNIWYAFQTRVGKNAPTSNIFHWSMALSVSLSLLVCLCSEASFFFLMQPTLSKWVSSMLDHLTFSTRRVMKREKKTETHLGNCGHSAPWNLLPGLEQWSHPHSRRRTSHPPSQMYLHLWTWNLGRGSNHCCYRPYMLLLVTIANNTHSIQGMVWL